MLLCYYVLWMAGGSGISNPAASQPWSIVCGVTGMEGFFRRQPDQFIGHKPLCCLMHGWRPSSAFFLLITKFNTLVKSTRQASITSCRSAFNNELAIYLNMAEIFGIATGTLSVAALFNNCVETFEYIQLGRHFGEDYQRYQLKLDVAQTRLGRWGEAVGVNSDIRFASASPSDKAVKDALSILEDIAVCFLAAQKKSRRYAERADKEELMVHNNNDMNLLYQRLHKRSRDTARRRQKSISVVKKAAWALYDKKSLENIVNQISSWVDELEKLFPIEATYQKYIEIKIEQVNDELSLKALKDAARGIDPALERAVERKVDSIEGKNSARDITMGDKARFHLGNVYSEETLQHEILVKDQTINSIGTISAKNETRIQIGNVYGGKGIWDY